MSESHKVIWAEHALTENGWQKDVCVEIDSQGTITTVSAEQKPKGTQVGILLPAMANLHSHAFQRAMAGMTETRGPDPKDSFWSWRKLMYGFLQHISPDDAEAIAAFGQMEMLESGYASVGEFHYLHHQIDGTPYMQCAEMCERLVSAANTSGIGLSLLPVLYEQGGCDGRALKDGQLRFGNSFDAFEKLYNDAHRLIRPFSRTMSLGLAPHSLRAVSAPTLSNAVQLAKGGPIHIHVAEQEAEVQELKAATNARPVEWLLDNQELNSSWCLIHATQMEPFETEQLAKTRAAVGLCPITESNLGDGIFDGVAFQRNNGVFGIGTDSNIRISLSEELRTLEYSQRLQHKGRAIYAQNARSNGRMLYDAALKGGAQALQRNSGAIATGRQADLLALNKSSANFIAVEEDQWLDAWIFAADDSLVSDVWSVGAHVVIDGQHIKREEIAARYKASMTALMQKL